MLPVTLIGTKPLACQPKAAPRFSSESEGYLRGAEVKVILTTQVQVIYVNIYIELTKENEGALKRREISRTVCQYGNNDVPWNIFLQGL